MVNTAAEVSKGFTENNIRQTRNMAIQMVTLCVFVLSCRKGVQLVKNSPWEISYVFLGSNLGSLLVKSETRAYEFLQYIFHISIVPIISKGSVVNISDETEIVDNTCLSS